MQDENLLTRPSEHNIVIPPTTIDLNDSGFTEEQPQEENNNSGNDDPNNPNDNPGQVSLPKMVDTNRLAALLLR
jgi:hypothetical protein